MVHGIKDKKVDKRVHLYARISKDDTSTEGVSIETQLEVMRSFAKFQNWHVVGESIDRGFSGTDDKRPEFQRMLGDARRGTFDLLAVAKIDRFMRNVRLFHQHIDDLHKVGVSFAAVAEGIDTSSESNGAGKLFLNILTCFAEFESTRIGERVRDARKTLISEHRWPAGRALFGYHWNKKDRRFDVIAEEAALIRLAFDMYVNGIPDEGKGKKSGGELLIAERLNALGYRTRRGKLWRGGIRDIIVESRYTGRDNNYTYPRIVEDDVFEVAQHRRRTARQIIRNPGQHLLQGMIICGICGRKVSPRVKHGAGRRRYYVCRGREKAAHLDASSRCTLGRIESDWLENEVTEAITEMFCSTPKVVEKHIRLRLASLEQESGRLQDIVAPQKAQADKLKEIMARVGERYENGELPRNEYLDKLGEYKAQLKAIESNMPTSDQKLRADYENLEERIEAIRSLIKGGIKGKLGQVRTDLQGFILQSPDLLREFMRQFDISIWAFRDRIEIRGLIPTQTVKQINSSACRTA